jgi:hypothetical protein
VRGSLRLALQVIGVALEHRTEIGHRAFDQGQDEASISGQFTETTIDAMVLVQAGRQPPCSFTARWAGPKSGDPNVIP